MQIYPRILTEDVQAAHLDDQVILHFLRNIDDLDVDITEPDVDAGLVRARKQLRLFIRDIEDEMLSYHTDERERAHPSPDFYVFSGGIRQRGVALYGYEEVTEEDREAQQDEDQQADADGREPDVIAPKYPDGTIYEVGAPNIVEIRDDLLRALRYTVADVAEHEVQRPSRHIEVKSEGQSHEEYDLTERPVRLYHRLREFDISTVWH